jgi:hypothetical protein
MMHKDYREDKDTKVTVVWLSPPDIRQPWGLSPVGSQHESLGETSTHLPRRLQLLCLPASFLGGSWRSQLKGLLKK